MSAKLKFSAGPLYWRAIRDAVSRCKFEGYKIELWEGSGFLSRDFVIKGDEKAIRAIADWVQRNQDAA